MSYTCEQAILGMMSASGPQDAKDLRRECIAQAVPYDQIVFENALAKLLAEGKIVFHDGYFDFPDAYYYA